MRTCIRKLRPACCCHGGVEGTLLPWYNEIATQQEQGMEQNTNKLELYKIAGAEKRKAKHMLCMCLCYGDPQRDVVCAQTTTASQDRPDRHLRLKTKSPGYENERCPRMRSPLITMPLPLRRSIVKKDYQVSGRQNVITCPNQTTGLPQNWQNLKCPLMLPPQAPQKFIAFFGVSSDAAGMA